MNRDELLTKLAMELGEWTERTDRMFYEGGMLMRVTDPRVITTDCAFYEHEWSKRRAELIKSPSWDDAPEWARWLAQDDDGQWWWYQEEPEQLSHAEGCFDTGGRLESAADGTTPAGHNWRDTLEPRPQAQAKPKTCRHCDITFNRPHIDGIPDDRCTRCDDEIKALWPKHEPAKTWWTRKTCIQCGHTTAAKVSDDRPVCPGCVAMGCDDYDEDSDEESALSQAMEEQMRAAAEKWARGDMEARSKYHREIKPGVWVDVYDVLRAWGVKNPALQHLIKKALAPGERGHKTLGQDMNDIVASAKRAKELEE